MDIVEVARRKRYIQERITKFLGKYSDDSLEFNGERIKLCSSDDFNDLCRDINEKIKKQKRAPIMISQVGGFYVMASLAAYAALQSRSKPVLLFFDRKTNNIGNAIYNTLLMQACGTREEYITTLFGLDNKDIIKALNKVKYEEYIVDIYTSEENVEGLKKATIKKRALRKYAIDTERYDRLIAEKHDLAHRALRSLEAYFNVTKLEEYASKLPYDKEKHLRLLEAVKGRLIPEHRKLFESLISSMTDYLAKGDNYHDLVKYLCRDMKKNAEHHVLCVPALYKSYRSLINSKGHSAVKFVPGVDISTDTGVKRLERILETEGLIAKGEKTDSFPIDFAFLPHAETLQVAYPFLKKYVENYIRVNRGTSNNFTMHPTASLNVRTYDSIGAGFIEANRKKRKSLTHLTPIEPQKKGFPLLTFIAGANIGNIYNSEEDLKNVIDMAIADRVDTVYIQGLIYATYYHNQTARRMLIDPKYETLDQRLKAAKKIIKRLNDAGIKVVYQMGDEEFHLYEDMFKIYTKEQGVKGNNFLAREDLKTAHDWVRPIIIQKLIPYLIRSGEDLTNFYTDEEQKTRVTELCHALKNYFDGLPLGDLAKYIKPEFLQDTEMFKVVYSTVDQYDENDPAVSVNLLSNPNFSTNTQYARPASGVIKNLKIHQTGALGNSPLTIPQLFVDGRQAFMSVAYKGDQVTMNVPQMIDDSLYIEHPELLSGIKEHIASDPTHKRVTIGGTRPNYPGGWTITGDAREKMTIVPYWRRSREVMEFVQRTGNGLEEVDVLSVNDFQIGSLTERLEYAIKVIDHFLYDYSAPKGVWVNGDIQQGWNYKGFADENRHLGTMNITQQMINFVEVVKPFIRDSFGVVRPSAFEGDYDGYRIDQKTSRDIISHLSSIDAIDAYMGANECHNLIKDGIDYKTLDLQLPPNLAPYEKTIREKLLDIKLLKFVHLKPGNHEWNSDWDKKGVNLIRMVGQELTNYKEVTGSSVEISNSEFIVNERGDILQSPHGCKTINGYNVVFSHLYGSAKGETPTQGMGEHFNKLGVLSSQVDRAIMGHLHVFETSVIDNKCLSLTGSSAGQSGFEQTFGLASKPLFVIDRYLPDGRLAIDTIGTEFLDDYKIQNPLIKELGLDNFIASCLSEEIGYYGFGDTPEKVQPVHPRQLVLGDPNKPIGPRIA